MSTKKATKYVGKKRRICGLNQTPPTGNTRVQSPQLGHLSHLDSYCRSRSQKTTAPSRVVYV
jgi:hypothetical protein